MSCSWQDVESVQLRDRSVHECVAAFLHMMALRLEMCSLLMQLQAC